MIINSSFSQKTKSIFYDDMGTTHQELLLHSKVLWLKENNLYELNYPLLHGLQSSLEKVNGDFPGGPVVKTLPSNAEGAGSIPG